MHVILTNEDAINLMRSMVEDELQRCTEIEEFSMLLEAKQSLEGARPCEDYLMIRREKR